MSKNNENAKPKKNPYKQDIKTAYGIGYAKGWDDAYTIPKRFGASLAASYGYKKGVRNRKRSDKYMKQYGKYSKNS